MEDDDERISSCNSRCVVYDRRNDDCPSTYIPSPMVDLAMITIDKTPSCAYCHQTATYLTKKGIAYEMIDVTEQHNQDYANLASLHGHTVPLVTNGKSTFVGWNLAKLNDMIREN